MSKIGEERRKFVERVSVISPAQKYGKPKQEFKDKKPKKEEITFSELLKQRGKQREI